MDPTYDNGIQRPSKSFGTSEELIGLADDPPTPCSFTEVAADKDHQTWSHRIVEHLRTLLKKAEFKAEAHAQAAHYFRSREIKLAIPSLLVPAISAPLVGILSQLSSCDNTYNPGTLLGVISLIISGTLNSLTSFFRYGVRTHEHLSASGEYKELCAVMSAELARSANFRTNVERFLTDIQKDFDRLIKVEPPLPLFIQRNAEAKLAVHKK
jgi:hypothetical protein